MVLTGAWIKVHYRMDEEGHYVNGQLPHFPPSKLMAVKAAVASCEDEPSYSETGQTYKKLIVKPDPKHPDRFLVKAGAVLVGFGVVDKDLEVVSTDEPINEQAGIEDDDDEN